MVLREGLEPSRRRHWFLRPTCLPIPSSERKNGQTPGVEPVFLAWIAVFFRRIRTVDHHPSGDMLPLH